MRGGIERQPVRLVIRDRDERLEGEVQHLLGAEFVLEHLAPGCRGVRERRVHVAFAQLVVQRNVGAAHPLEVLEVRKRSGRLEFVMHEDFVRCGFDLVIDRRQFLVVGDDQRRGILGDMRIVGQHHRHRLADIMHLADARGSAGRGTPGRNRDAE